MRNWFFVRRVSESSRHARCCCFRCLFDILYSMKYDFLRPWREEMNIRWDDGDEAISHDRDDGYDKNENDNDDVNTVMTLIFWPARPLLLFLPIESSYKVVIFVKKEKQKRNTSAWGTLNMYTYIHGHVLACESGYVYYAYERREREWARAWEMRGKKRKSVSEENL